MGCVSKRFPVIGKVNHHVLNSIIAEVVLYSRNAFLEYFEMLVVNFVDIYPMVECRRGSYKNVNLTLRLNSFDIALFKLISEYRFTVLENCICGFHRRFK